VAINDKPRKTNRGVRNLDFRGGRFATLRVGPADSDRAVETSSGTISGT